LKTASLPKQNLAGSAAELGLAHPVDVVGGAATGEAAVADRQGAGLAVILIVQSKKSVKIQLNFYNMAL
jgi:hypothetical protein